MEGQVLRSSRQATLSGVHLLRVVAQDLGITLVQGQVAPAPNEAQAVLPLLKGVRIADIVSQ